MKNIKHIEEKYNIKKQIAEIFGTILGSFVISIGISLFLLPNQLSSGGIAGIGTIIYYLLKIPMGTTIILLNIPLFLISILKIGKSFFVKSLIGTISLSTFIDCLDKFKPLTQDRFLACIYGGIIIGVGTAIILKVNSSTGGTDMVTYIAKKYKPSIRTGNIIVIIDIIIVTLNMFFFREIEIGLYSGIAIYLMGKIIDILFEGIDFTKLIFIVSKKSEEIAEKIGKSIERGTTGIYGKGMYTNEEILILMCAVTRRDVSKVTEIAKKIDKNSFIIITNSREVLGQGFKRA
ncbi:MAG: YitT family protein [Clostridia bacterium]|nr:YitT family protein [Clostridium sp.]